MIASGKRGFFMEKQRVMFICIHNSGRSQMAEAFLRHLASDRFEVHSAGLEAGTLNPLVVKAMEEIGIPMDGHYAKKAFEYVKRGERFDYVVTVCDESNAERCPTFPGKVIRMHWSFPDPSALQGTDEEKLAGIRLIRDEIQIKVKHWCQART
jgi:arsenate reductase (thioredoxin)